MLHVIMNFRDFVSLRHHLRLCAERRIMAGNCREEDGKVKGRESDVCI